MASIKYILTLFFVVVLGLSEASVTWMRIKRGIDQNKLDAPASEVRYCDPVTPCGWHVYSPYSKEPEYYIENTYCICSKELLCVRTSDDTNTGAYIHNCRTEAPKELSYLRAPWTKR